MKILFLASNPVNVPSRLRSEVEYRDIEHEISKGTHRGDLELVFVPAARADDLLNALLYHRPDIVHFSGHCNTSGAILLEDDDGYCKPVSREAIYGLFRALKDNIRVVVLNACYAKDQAEALSEIIDITIGVSDTIEDSAAIMFSSRFYKILSFGRSVEEAFNAAMARLQMEDIDAAHRPELLAREGVSAAETRILKPDRRLEPSRRIRKKIFLTLIPLIAAFGLWLLLPVFARYYNEKGFDAQYGEPPDLSRAREYYQLALRLNPSYAQAHYNLATVYEDFQPEKAMEEYLLAIRHDSHIYPAYNNLARLYLRRGKDNDYESALNILSQANDLAPQDESVQYSLSKNLGWAHYALRRYPMAEMYLRRAISHGGQQGGAAAHCLLAYVLKTQGKPGVADECFDCVSLAPSEKEIEARWVTDAQDCLMGGSGK